MKIRGGSSSGVSARIDTLVDCLELSLPEKCNTLAYVDDLELLDEVDHTNNLCLKTDILLLDNGN